MRIKIRTDDGETKTMKKKPGRPATGVTKERVTVTLDKDLVPLARRVAAKDGGLSALVETLLRLHVAEITEASK